MAPKTALYCRVSTVDQSLARQRRLTSEYATETLGIEPAAIDVYLDKRTGTDTDRDGYRELMEAVEEGEVERVITSEVSRISRSVRDFSATVERVVDECGVALHVLDMGIDLDPDERDPYTRAFLQVAATFAELEAEIKRQNTREGIAASRAQGKWHGRPPFGFDVGPEGYLSPNDDFEAALVVPDELDKGASKRELARSIGISRPTIRAIDENRERYTTDMADGSAASDIAEESGETTPLHEGPDPIAQKHRDAIRRGAEKSSDG
jgi:DNA invertase Pin-like site-specific DNA recombinase